jgi:hypothetical protein
MGGRRRYELSFFLPFPPWGGWPEKGPVQSVGITLFFLPALGWRGNEETTMLIKAFTATQLRQLPDVSEVRSGLSGASQIYIKDDTTEFGRVEFWSSDQRFKKSLPVPAMGERDYLVVTPRDIFVIKSPDANVVACLEADRLPPKTRWVPRGSTLRQVLAAEDESRLLRALIMRDGQEGPISEVDLDIPIMESVHITLPFLTPEWRWEMYGDDRRNGGAFRSYLRIVVAA